MISQGFSFCVANPSGVKVSGAPRPTARRTRPAKAAASQEIARQAQLAWWAVSEGGPGISTTG
jgi:hypothetical protein